MVTTRSIASLVVSSTLLVGFAFAGAMGGTTVPGGVITGATWTQAGSPYHVIGDIAVDGLTIEPGVEVLFDPDVTLSVTSTIDAQGSANELITFDAWTPGSPWGGIRMDGTPPGSFFSHCVIRAAGNSGLNLVEAMPVIEDCLFEGNAAPELGGGLFASLTDGDLHLVRCRFVANTAGVRGGGLNVLLGTGTVHLDECEIVDNAASSTGPVYARGGGAYLLGNVALTKTLIQNNRAESVQTSAEGGGAFFYAIPGQTVTVDDCVFRANRVSSDVDDVRGGGLCSPWVGELFVSNSLFIGNELDSDVAGSLGGGLFVDGALELIECRIEANLGFGHPNKNGIGLSHRGDGVYERCIIIRNVGGNSGWNHSSGFLTCTNFVLACNDGVGVFVSADFASFVNCTVAWNEGRGISISTGSGPVSIRNSIVYANNSGGNQISGGFNVLYQVDYSLVQGGTVPGVGNLTSFPAFTGGDAEICTLADLKIRPSSPCIDAGDPDPVYEEGCVPPTLGFARNDMGAHGGPGACLWGSGWDFAYYCQATENSVAAQGAHIRATGTASHAAGDLTLLAGPVPPGAPAIFYYGEQELSGIPLGDGFRCVGGSIFRLPILFASGAGTLSLPIPASSAVSGSEFIPGNTWHFQAWYRDPMSPGVSTFNLSDGVSITFGP